jgi:hypothetical protein
VCRRLQSPYTFDQLRWAALVSSNLDRGLAWLGFDLLACVGFI